MTASIPQDKGLHNNDTSDHPPAASEPPNGTSTISSQATSPAFTSTAPSGSNPSPDDESKTTTCICGCLWYYVIYSFFLIVKYLAQLATVPLILMQIFDSYSLLCFVPNDEYCTRTSEYRIHAVQTIITVSFFCSLALALLANTILEWNPWPKSFIEERSCKCI